MSQVEFLLPLSTLERIMRSYYEEQGLKENDIRIRKEISKEVERIITPKYYTAQVHLFGSSVNGFGVKGADLDLVVQLRAYSGTSEIKLEKRETESLFQSIEQRIKNSGKFQIIGKILDARVPIIQFRHLTTQLEGDLSACHLESVRNSELLQKYTNMDKRVIILGCFLKKLAKVCDIADAKKSHLSSLAYTVMMIHYLQQCAVLPVLENSGTRFRSTNQQTVAQLWNGFLNYFSNFDFNKNVVSMNHYELLPKSSHLFKNWIKTESGISILKPLDPDMDLGRCLSREMSVHTIRTIRHWRDIFQKSKCTKEPHKFHQLDVYLTSCRTHQDLFNNPKWLSVDQ